MLYGSFADFGQTLTKGIFWLNRTGWLVNMCLKSVGNFEKTVVLSSYCSVFPSFILNMFLIASLVQLKIRYNIPMTIFVFQTFEAPFFDRKSFSEQRYVNSDSVKNQFWHICHIFALKCQEQSVSKKCSQHSYHHILLSLKLSQSSKIFLRSLFPEKATPEQS